MALRGVGSGVIHLAAVLTRVLRDALRVPAVWCFAVLGALLGWAAASLDVLALDRSATSSSLAALSSVELMACLACIWVAARGFPGGGDPSDGLSDALEAARVGSVGLLAARWLGAAITGTIQFAVAVSLLLVFCIVCGWADALS